MDICGHLQARCTSNSCAALGPLPAELLCTVAHPPAPPHLLLLAAWPCRRLGEIRSVAGQAAPRQEVLDALAGGDFDPEEYDRQMAAAFGDDYYGAVSAPLWSCCAAL